MPVRWGNNGNSEKLFLDSKIAADSDFSREIKSCDQPRQHNKKQRHYFVKGGNRG